MAFTAACSIASVANFLLMICRTVSEPLSTATVIDLQSRLAKTRASFSVTVLVRTEATLSRTCS